LAKTSDWEWRIDSEPVQVKNVVREILGRLDEKLPHQTHEDRCDLRLILSELLINAVIHGNASDTSKQVHIRISVEGADVRAWITDEGSGFNYRSAMDSCCGDGGLYHETGRGMQLVMVLADVVSFDSRGSCVSFVKRIGAVKGNG